MLPKFVCPGGNEAESLEGPCEEVECQSCCQHEDFDHDMCLDCGYERCPGDAIDRAMDSWEDR